MIAECLTAADRASLSAEIVEGSRTGKRLLIEYLPPRDGDFGADVRLARMFLEPQEPPKWPD